ncbi:hypothetical protein ES332_A05G170600v1 [Gossypium tomentosum]|uniref:Uncharacterized protein n=1 Tax=Gossypium tomentosum TaxID=34277 RepID=A0A5D2QFL8_GOSTO|nr:hypothetical protein ES332_A05G170600v1 [Gossypium tomentosum]
MTTRRPSLLSPPKPLYLFFQNLHPPSSKNQDQGNLFKTLPISFSLKSLLVCLHPMLQIWFLPKLWYTNHNGERGVLEMGTNQIA